MIDLLLEAGYNPQRLKARILTVSSNEINHSRSDLKRPSLRQFVGSALMAPQNSYPSVGFLTGQLGSALYS